MAALAATLPDLDLIGWPLGIPDNSLLAHRGLTHSIPFALALGALFAVAGFRRPEWTGARLRIGIVLALAIMTHGLLDSTTTYGWGVEFWAPFSQVRYRLYPLLAEVNHHRWVAFEREIGLILIPALVLLWLGRRIRRPSGGA